MDPLLPRVNFGTRHRAINSPRPAILNCPPSRKEPSRGMALAMRHIPSGWRHKIGSNWFSPRMQQTRTSTEAAFLLMIDALDTSGYQRLVWRCSTENTLSLKAARRFGFKFEGTWRRVALVKGKHVDFAWHSSPPVKTGPREIRPGRRLGRTSSQPRIATWAAPVGR